MTAIKSLSDVYNDVESNNIEILEYKIGNRKSIIAKIDNEVTIALNKSLIETAAEEKSYLIHEFGHFNTASYYTFNTKYELRCQKEYRANRWAVHEYLPADELLAAVSKGFTETYQLAEYFDVTEDFIRTALNIYRREGII